MNFAITGNACRVCLAEQEIMINLFDTVEDFQRQRLSDLLETCTDLKVDKNDGQPKLICDECTGELLVVAKFHEKCKRTLEILENLLHSVDDDSMLKDETQIVGSLEEEKKLIEMDDLDGFIVEEHDIDKADTEEIDQTDSMDEKLMFEEVGYVEEDINNAQFILFEPGEVKKKFTTEDFNGEKDFEENDPNVDEQITPAERKKLNRTTVVPRPLIINCICDVCGAGFTHFNNLTRHIYTHNPEEIFVCSICKYPFTTNVALENHSIEHKKDRDIIENDLDDVKCEENDPGEKSDGLSEMKVNDEIENLCNATDKPRKSKICNICNKRFVSKSALEAHIRTHTGDRPFKCDICTKAFKTHGGLVLHLRRHSGVRPYTCYVCNKGFGESSNLRVHMRTHTGEKPHKCTICDRSFTRVFLLQIHQRTHTGERPYQCPYCDRAFTQGGDLASHKRTHTGERPHVCKFCNKGFIKSSGLTQHMRKHMNQEMNSRDTSYKLEDKKGSKNFDFRLLMVKESGNESDDADFKDPLKLDDYAIDFSQDIES